MKIRTSLVVGCMGLTTLAFKAQKPPQPEQPWSSLPVIKVWPGTAPGSEGDRRTESMMVAPTPEKLHIVRNVSTPTMTVFQPKSGNTTGTAALVCPGGGFRVLAIDEEGYQVADWLSQHGVTVFVLKYRIAPTPASDAEFAPPGESLEQGMKRMMAPLPPGQVAMSIADGVQALKVVRQNAGKFGFSPDRVVALGFSAGGGVVTGTASAPVLERPNYVASIYGALLPDMSAPPKDAPPFFLAMAEDDPLVQPMVLRLFTALRDSGAKPEFHVYRSGSHGFSMKQRGTSDYWLQELWWWMDSFHLTTPTR